MNAIYVWGIARAYGGQVVLRIEDHDRGRCRNDYERALLDDLDWLGFVPDVASTHSFRDDADAHLYRQSNNRKRYQAALNALAIHGAVYPCVCSRRSIAALAAKTGEDPLRYPGTCRLAAAQAHATHARRFQLPDTAVVFDDIRCGEQTQWPQQQCGDVLVRDAHNNFTYQLAVTVDDYEHNIDVIIRGEDLLDSTGRQWLMAAALGRHAMPLTVHHPLLLRPDGVKLSKSNGDTGIRERRDRGDSAAAVIGDAAFQSGLATSPAPIDANDVARLFVNA